MRFDVVTLFPEMVAHAAAFGVTGRALERGLWQLSTWNPRDFTQDNHRTVDDRPYGGGPGMVMLPEPLEKALAAARAAQHAGGYAATRTLHLTPAGAPLSHARVAALAAEGDATGYVLIAGRYEGLDERLVARAVDEEIAIGDFVVSGGELPALMLIDAVVRQRPGVLNDAESAVQDSFVAGLLDCPHYTRPEEYGGERVRACRGRRWHVPLHRPFRPVLRHAPDRHRGAGGGRHLWYGPARGRRAGGLSRLSASSISA